MERDELFNIKHDLLNNYKITKNGKIWSNKSKIFLKQKICNGYAMINIRNIVNATIHRLVAITFIPNNDPTKKIINHKDENKLNNHVNNLEWVTQKQNVNLHSKEICHKRKVIKKTKSGKILRYFNSVTEAGNSIGLTRYAISKVCLGTNKTAGGFIWEYVNTQLCHKIVDLNNGKQIKFFENYYIFDNGRIFNKTRKCFLKPIKNASDYCYVTLCNKGKKGKKKNIYIHRLVGSYFLKNPDNKSQINHKDKIRSNNHIDNLEWVTPSENMLHANNKTAS